MFPALPEGLIPKSSLGFWLVSGITQYDSILEFRGFRFNADKIQTQVHRDTDTCVRACTRVHMNKAHAHICTCTCCQQMMESGFTPSCLPGLFLDLDLSPSVLQGTVTCPPD